MLSLSNSNDGYSSILGAGIGTVAGTTTGTRFGGSDSAYETASGEQTIAKLEGVN